MLPNPIHPLVVHFPLVLVVLLPLFAAGTLWVIRRGARARRAWLLPVALAGAVTASAFIALRTGEADLISDVTDEELRQIARDARHLELLRGLGLRSSMSVPMIARGRTLGTLTFGTTASGRRYTTADLALAEELARRAALAVDNARLYREAQRRLAELTTVQQIARAITDGRAHGFEPLPVRVVPGADHGPLPGPVLAWFDSLRAR